MRLLLIGLLLCGLVREGVAADTTAVQTFDGVGGKTTPSFQVGDNWTVQWDFKDPYLLTVLSSDGTHTAGIADALKGSLSLPKGGTYQLQIDPVSDASRLGWHITVLQNAPATKVVIATNISPPPSDSTTASTNMASSLIFPSPGKNPIPSSPIAPTEGLTTDEAHSVVLIKGDVAEGTGFFLRTADGLMVVTNLHVISGNPNVKITTTTGAEIKTVGLKGASDRDLAMFSIQDDHYAYLELAADVQNTAQAGDEVITPGNSEGGEVMLDTKGKLLGIGPERVEFDNPIYHGNSGGPVFHTSSGKVIAVVTQALKVDTNNELDKASFNNKNSAIAGTMRYFGLRLDTVPKWEVYDPAQFLAETTFLKNFHDQSRCLDSFLNGAQYEKAHWPARMILVIPIPITSCTARRFRVRVITITGCRLTAIPPRNWTRRGN
jgi:S1-C subfamily serine protease